MSRPAPTTPMGGRGAARALAWLLWPRIRGLRNLPRSRDRQGRLRYVVLAVFALGFMTGGFAGARWLFTQFLELEVLAELLIGRVLDIVLLFFIGLLVFSNTIAAFTTLYLADDLPLLVSSPVGPARLYLARLVDTWTQASWMMLVFALPILAGCGPVLGASVGWYVALPLLLLPLTVLCAAVGSILTMALARWLPAQRTHDVLLVLAMVGFLVIYIAFRLAEPERFLEPGGFADLAALIGSLSADRGPSTPSDWVVDSLFALLRGEPAEAALPAATLYLAAAAACAVGAWLARAVYLRSFTRAQEGRVEGEGLLRRLLGPLMDRRRPPRVPSSVVDAFVARDNRIFVRTTGQWTQLLLIAALVVVYLFNFKYFRTLQATGVIGDRGLFFVNLVLGGLVVTTVAVRFLYPAVSLEGRAFWAVQVAPITPEQLLKAHVRWGLWPLMALAVGLTVASDLIVGLPLWMIPTSAVIAGVMTWALCGMGVGLGATAPRFHEANPARIASGMGGVLFMLGGLFYMIATLALVGWPLSALGYWMETGFVPRPARLAQLAGMVLAALALTAAAHVVPMRLGARALRRREG